MGLSKASDGFLKRTRVMTAMAKRLEKKLELSSKLSTLMNSDLSLLDDCERLARICNLLSDAYALKRDARKEKTFQELEIRVQELWNKYANRLSEQKLNRKVIKVTDTTSTTARKHRRRSSYHAGDTYAGTLSSRGSSGNVSVSSESRSHMRNNQESDIAFKDSGFSSNITEGRNGNGDIYLYTADSLVSENRRHSRHTHRDRNEIGTKRDTKSAILNQRKLSESDINSNQRRRSSSPVSKSSFNAEQMSSSDLNNTDLSTSTHYSTDNHSRLSDGYITTNIRIRHFFPYHAAAMDEHSMSHSFNSGSKHTETRTAIHQRHDIHSRQSYTDDIIPESVRVAVEKALSDFEKIDWSKRTRRRHSFSARTQADYDSDPAAVRGEGRSASTSSRTSHRNSEQDDKEARYQSYTTKYNVKASSFSKSRIPDSKERYGDCVRNSSGHGADVADYNGNMNDEKDGQVVGDNSRDIRSNVSNHKTADATFSESYNGIPRRYSKARNSQSASNESLNMNDNESASAGKVLQRQDSPTRRSPKTDIIPEAVRKAVDKALRDFENIDWSKSIRRRHSFTTIGSTDVWNSPQGSSDVKGSLVGVTGGSHRRHSMANYNQPMKTKYNSYDDTHTFSETYNGIPRRYSKARNSLSYSVDSRSRDSSPDSPLPHEHVWYEVRNSNQYEEFSSDTDSHVNYDYNKDSVCKGYMDDTEEQGGIHARTMQSPTHITEYDNRNSQEIAKSMIIRSRNSTPIHFEAGDSIPLSRYKPRRREAGVGGNDKPKRPVPMKPINHMSQREYVDSQQKYDSEVESSTEDNRGTASFTQWRDVITQGGVRGSKHMNHLDEPDDSRVSSRDSITNELYRSSNRQYGTDDSPKLMTESNIAGNGNHNIVIKPAVVRQDKNSEHASLAEHRPNSTALVSSLTTCDQSDQDSKSNKSRMRVTRKHHSLDHMDNRAGFRPIIPDKPEATVINTLPNSIHTNRSVKVTDRDMNTDPVVILSESSVTDPKSSTESIRGRQLYPESDQSMTETESLTESSGLVSPTMVVIENQGHLAQDEHRQESIFHHPRSAIHTDTIAFAINTSDEFTTEENMTISDGSDIHTLVLTSNGEETTQPMAELCTNINSGHTSQYKEILDKTPSEDFQSEHAKYITSSSNVDTDSEQQEGRHSNGPRLKSSGVQKRLSRDKTLDSAYDNAMKVNSEPHEQDDNEHEDCPASSRIMAGPGYLGDSTGSSTMGDLASAPHHNAIDQHNQIVHRSLTPQSYTDMSGRLQNELYDGKKDSDQPEQKSMSEEKRMVWNNIIQHHHDKSENVITGNNGFDNSLIKTTSGVGVNGNNNGDYFNKSGGDGANGNSNKISSLEDDTDKQVMELDNVDIDIHSEDHAFPDVGFIKQAAERVCTSDAQTQTILWGENMYWDKIVDATQDNVCIARPVMSNAETITESLATKDAEVATEYITSDAHTYTDIPSINSETQTEESAIGPVFLEHDFKPEQTESQTQTDYTGGSSYYNEDIFSDNNIEDFVNIKPGVDAQIQTDNKSWHDIGDDENKDSPSVYDSDYINSNPEVVVTEDANTQTDLNVPTIALQGDSNCALIYHENAVTQTEVGPALDSEDVQTQTEYGLQADVFNYETNTRIYESVIITDNANTQTEPVGLLSVEDAGIQTEHEDPMAAEDRSTQTDKGEEMRSEDVYATVGEFGPINHAGINTYSDIEQNGFGRLHSVKTTAMVDDAHTQTDPNAVTTGVDVDAQTEPGELANCIEAETQTALGGSLCVIDIDTQTEPSQELKAEDKDTKLEHGDDAEILALRGDPVQIKEAGTQTEHNGRDQVNSVDTQTEYNEHIDVEDVKTQTEHSAHEEVREVESQTEPREQIRLEDVETQTEHTSEHVGGQMQDDYEGIHIAEVVVAMSDDFDIHRQHDHPANVIDAEIQTEYSGPVITGQETDWPSGPEEGTYKNFFHFGHGHQIGYGNGDLNNQNQSVITEEVETQTEETEPVETATAYIQTEQDYPFSSTANDSGLDNSMEYIDIKSEDDTNVRMWDNNSNPEAQTQTEPMKQLFKYPETFENLDSPHLWLPVTEDAQTQTDSFPTEQQKDLTGKITSIDFVIPSSEPSNIDSAKTVKEPTMTKPKNEDSPLHAGKGIHGPVTDIDKPDDNNISEVTGKKSTKHDDFSDGKKTKQESNTEEPFGHTKMAHYGLPKSGESTDEPQETDPKSYKNTQKALNYAPKNDHEPHPEREPLSVYGSPNILDSGGKTIEPGDLPRRNGGEEIQVLPRSKQTHSQSPNEESRPHQDQNPVATGTDNAVNQYNTGIPELKSDSTDNMPETTAQNTDGVVNKLPTTASGVRRKSIKRPKNNESTPKTSNIKEIPPLCSGRDALVNPSDAMDRRSLPEEEMPTGSILIATPQQQSSDELSDLLGSQGDARPEHGNKGKIGLITLPNFPSVQVAGTPNSDRGSNLNDQMRKSRSLSDHLDKTLTMFTPESTPVTTPETSPTRRSRSLSGGGSSKIPVRQTPRERNDKRSPSPPSDKKKSGPSINKSRHHQEKSWKNIVQLPTGHFCFRHSPTPSRSTSPVFVSEKSREILQKAKKRPKVIVIDHSGDCGVEHSIRSYKKEQKPPKGLPSSSPTKPKSRETSPPEAPALTPGSVHSTPAPKESPTKPKRAPVARKTSKGVSSASQKPPKPELAHRKLSLNKEPPKKTSTLRKSKSSTSPLSDKSAGDFPAPRRSSTPESKGTGELPRPSTRATKEVRKGSGQSKAQQSTQLPSKISGVLGTDSTASGAISVSSPSRKSVDVPQSSVKSKTVPAARKERTKSPSPSRGSRIPLPKSAHR